MKLLVMSGMAALAFVIFAFALAWASGADASARESGEHLPDKNRTRG